jgi:enolase
VKIHSVKGREILDSRGNPTVEVDVTLAGGAFGRAAVPSGASTGEREALELRDGDRARYRRQGRAQGGRPHQRRACRRLVRIRADQRSLDAAMIALDGTSTKSRLGANALLGVSMAALRADAASKKCRSIGTSAAVRERDVHPAGADDEHPERRRARRFQRRLPGIHGHAAERRIVRRSAAHGRRNLHSLARDPQGTGQSTGVGDEGGFAPNLKSNREAVEVVLEAIGKAGLKAGEDIFIALDVASSELVGRRRQVHLQESRANRIARRPR